MACNESSDFSASDFSCPSATCDSKYGSQAGAKSKYQAYEGKDVFLWLSTRLDKSVCYEALSFVFHFKLRTNFTIDIINGGPGCKPEMQCQGSKGCYFVRAHAPKQF